MKNMKTCKKPKIKGELQNYKHQTIPTSNTLHSLWIGNLDITYYTVPLLPPLKKTGAYMKVRSNKEKHIRSTWSSLLLTSFLTKGIHVEEILEYGWYTGFVTCHLSWFLAFPNLLLVFSYQTCQPIQSSFPLACMNSLNFYKCLLLGLCLCLYSHAANSLLFATVACVFTMTQMQCASFAVLFGTFLVDSKKDSGLSYCTTTWEILGSISSRV
jgi:hypothetical protein